MQWDAEVFFGFSACRFQSSSLSCCSGSRSDRNGLYHRGGCRCATTNRVPFLGGQLGPDRGRRLCRLDVDADPDAGGIGARHDHDIALVRSWSECRHCGRVHRCLADHRAVAVGRSRRLPDRAAAHALGRRAYRRDRVPRHRARAARVGAGDSDRRDAINARHAWDDRRRDRDREPASRRCRSSGGDRQPSENELEGARYQGRHVARVAAALAGAGGGIAG